jgi:hypothetical protein
MLKGLSRRRTRKTSKTRRTSRKTSRRTSRRTSRKTSKRRTVRRTKRTGGAAENKSFNSNQELASYLANNKNWIDRVNVYTKKGYYNNERSIYQYEKQDFSKLLELNGNINEYEFVFY